MLKALLEDTRKILKVFATGAVLFFLGMGVIQWADWALEASLRQEVFVFMGAALGGLGFITSMFAQCLLIAQRFINMGNSHQKNHNKQD